MAVSWLLPDEAETMRAAIARRAVYEAWEKLQRIDAAVREGDKRYDSMIASETRRSLYEAWERLQAAGWTPAEVSDSLAMARALLRLMCALRGVDAA